MELCAVSARLRDAKGSNLATKPRGRTMNRTIGLTLASAILLAAGFAATRAEAFMPKPAGLDAAAAIATPAAMCGRSCRHGGRFLAGKPAGPEPPPPLPTPAAVCGRSCRNGGRYIPGPPSVCADEGLNYCGSSRGGGGGGGAVVVVPGTGVGGGVGPGGVRW